MTDLLLQISQLAGLAESTIWSFALVFLRVGAMVALLPALGEQIVPVRVRLGAAIGLAVVVFPTQAGWSGVFQATPSVMIAEVLAGLVFGFSIRLLVLSLQTAGTIAAQSMSLSQMFAGVGPEPQPIVSNLLVFSGLAVFVAMGGLSSAATLIAYSYQVIPIGSFPDPSQIGQWELERISQGFRLAFSLAAPFVLASMLYNLTLGAINRAMPQLMVSLVGAPALTLGGLALLAIASPFLLSEWSEAVKATLSSPFGG